MQPVPSVTATVFTLAVSLSSFPSSLSIPSVSRILAGFFSVILIGSFMLFTNCLFTSFPDCESLNTEPNLSTINVLLFVVLFFALSVTVTVKVYLPSYFLFFSKSLYAAFPPVFVLLFFTERPAVSFPPALLRLTLTLSKYGSSYAADGVILALYPFTSETPVILTTGASLSIVNTSFFSADLFPAASVADITAVYVPVFETRFVYVKSVLSGVIFPQLMVSFFFSRTLVILPEVLTPLKFCSFILTLRLFAPLV